MKTPSISLFPKSLIFLKFKLFKGGAKLILVFDETLLFIKLYSSSTGTWSKVSILLQTIVSVVGIMRMVKGIERD